MFDIFQNTSRPKKDLFFKKNDKNDIRLGEFVSFQTDDYKASEVVIIGCPQDDGIARNKGRIGAALAPTAIRAQFYKLSDFDVSVTVFDLGDTKIQSTLEQTHDLHTKIVEQILRDNKQLIVLGGGNDISYPDGTAIANVFGKNNWLAFNIDAHFDVRADFPRNSGTPYRQLLEEELLNPKNFFEMGWQPQSNSKIYYTYLQNLGVGLINLFELKKEVSITPLFIENNFSKILTDSDTNAVFWGFDLDSVCSSDAPGTSAPSPIGLTAEDFVLLCGTAGFCQKTKLIEFSEVNPLFDIDNRTAKLVACGMQKFLSSIKKAS